MGAFNPAIGLPPEAAETFRSTGNSEDEELEKLRQAAFGPDPEPDLIEPRPGQRIRAVIADAIAAFGAAKTRNPTLRTNFLGDFVRQRLRNDRLTRESEKANTQRQREEAQFQLSQRLSEKRLDRQENRQDMAFERQLDATVAGEERRGAARTEENNRVLGIQRQDAALQRQQGLADSAEQRRTGLIDTGASIGALMRPDMTVQQALGQIAIQRQKNFEAKSKGRRRPDHIQSQMRIFNEVDAALLGGVDANGEEVAGLLETIATSDDPADPDGDYLKMRKELIADLDLMSNKDMDAIGEGGAQVIKDDLDERMLPALLKRMEQQAEEVGLVVPEQLRMKILRGDEGAIQALRLAIKRRAETSPPQETESRRASDVVFGPIEKGVDFITGGSGG